MKDVASSSELRKWFNHDPAKWKEFQKKYREELSTKSEVIAELRKLHEKHGTITLLYAARDEEFNQAVVIRELFVNSQS
jgi:uncharacterized protein YeaO (DUF488 family)